MLATKNQPKMDSHTLDLLEFDKVRDLLAGYAASSLGRDLAKQLEPGTIAEKIRGELALVSEMVEALIDGQAPPFSGLHDVRLLVRRAAIGTALTAEQLLEVGETLNVTGAMYRYRAKLNERHGGLIDLLTAVEDHGAVAKTISGCIDGRAHVLDMASRELGVVRQKLFELEEKVKAEVRRLLRDPELRKILSYPNATVNGDHYVLPVAVNHRHKVEGIIHRVSGTGETVFVEPASIARLSAERITLKAEEDREVKRILRRLSQEVGRVSKPLCYSLEILAKLDLITAKARYSRDFSMFAPLINDDGKLWLRNARHPVLENIFRNESRPDGTPPRKVVPLDLRLGLGFNLLIITGPNTGGKTVTLKTTGLLCLMAQCGMHVPAGEGSTVPIFRQILSDIGDEQSLEQSLSTFSSHISRIAKVFELADDRSLILLDELGAGTDPVEGAALGRAILDQLDSISARAIVTTHLGDLKTYAFNNERAENGAVEFDDETLRPTYKLHIGQYGMSNALKIARRLKLPKELLKRAHRYLKRRKGKTGELARLQELRAEAEKAKLDALAAQHEADQQKAEYERKATALEREQQEAEALNAQRERLKANDRVHVSRFDAVGKVVRVDAKKQIITVTLGLGQWEVPFAEVTPVAD
ncbi:endonuclease MutS2 [Limnoglobus roseus]|uniref:DNA strand exchange inhibitor protein n=1 Tax=Limnoglobus roseus TaxID=2598579 RepID=A0A5C1AJ75_9BACT|nr:DNA strand exchange inhibitor protein [Limnoglobus roseus]QEL18056.1 DNA strand exchange inhibitor protein [Limnoglobus roseus]